MTIVCTFLTFVEATSSFKMFEKKKDLVFFCMGKCYPFYLVGNNFYLNVLNNHRNVKGQQICRSVRHWQRNLSFFFMFTFVFKTFFMCLCICFLLKVSYCTFYLSGLFYSLRSSCEWMSVCVKVCVCEIIIEPATSFGFQHAVELRLGSCIFLLWWPDVA